MLLAIFGFFLAIASLIYVALFYRNMVGSSDWNSFNDYQKFHIILHGLVILFSLSWISGFVLHTLNSRIYIFMSAVSESLVYLIQIIISVIVIRYTQNLIIFRLWMESEQIRVKIQPLLFVFILPSIVYIITVASYVGNSSYTTAKVATIALDVMNVFRFLIALASFLFSVFIKETEFADYNVTLISNFRFSC